MVEEEENSSKMKKRRKEDKEEQVFSVTAPGLIGVYRGEEFEIIRKVEKH